MMPAVGGLGGTARAEELPPATEPTAAPAPADAPAETGAHAVGDPRGAQIAVRVDRKVEARFGLMFKDAAAVRARPTGCCGRWPRA